MAKTAPNPFQITLKENQKEIVHWLNENTISVVTGMEGTSKTTLALFYALQQLFKGNYERIVITKPLQTTGQEIGFLPGIESEKLLPFTVSYINAIETLIGKGMLKSLMGNPNHKQIDFLALPYVRGLSLTKCILIFDEVQNADLHTIMSFVTRADSSCKVILLGDPFQSDIKKSGLKPFIEMTSEIGGISHRELGEDYQMRSKMIVELRKAYIKHLNAQK